jgi:tetratricopeptide (TPR) repeat protein
MDRSYMIRIGGAFFVLMILFTGAIQISGSKILWGASEKNEKLAGNILNMGCDLFEAGDYEGSIYVWAEVIDSHPGTTSWPKAVYNTGLAYENLKDYREAIEYFKILLTTNVNNKEPGANVMEAYRNYQHKACMEISWCYETMEDYNEALKYAKLGRDRYVYETWCGTCYGMHMSWLREKIEFLDMMAEWTKNKALICRFLHVYELSTDDPGGANIILPFPRSGSGRPDLFFNRTSITNGRGDLSLTDTNYGTGLNISFKELCTITIEWEAPYGTQVGENETFEGFSLEVDERYGWYFGYLDMEGSEDRDVSVRMEGIWIRYSPEPEFDSWGQTWSIGLSPGWDSYPFLSDGYY